MTKQVFRTISFGERYLTASLIYIGLGFLAISLMPNGPNVLAAGSGSGCTHQVQNSEGEWETKDGCKDGETCCDGKCSTTPSGNGSLACCGDKPYRFGGEEMPCCNNKLLSSSQGCCRSSSGSEEIYSTSSQSCCGNYKLGKVYSKNSSTEGCCGLYPAEKYYIWPEDCCGQGDAAKIYNARDEICCAGFSPAPEMFTAETGDKTKCKCCELDYYRRGLFCLP